MRNGGSGWRWCSDNLNDPCVQSVWPIPRLRPIRNGGEDRVHVQQRASRSFTGFDWQLGEHHIIADLWECHAHRSLAIVARTLDAAGGAVRLRQPAEWLAALTWRVVAVAGPGRVRQQLFGHPPIGTFQPSVAASSTSIAIDLAAVFCPHCHLEPSSSANSSTALLPLAPEARGTHSSARGLKAPSTCAKSMTASFGCPSPIWTAIRRLGAPCPRAPDPLDDGHRRTARRADLKDSLRRTMWCGVFSCQVQDGAAAPPLRTRARGESE